MCVDRTFVSSGGGTSARRRRRKKSGLHHCRDWVFQEVTARWTPLSTVSPTTVAVHFTVSQVGRRTQSCMRNRLIESVRANVRAHSAITQLSARCSGDLVRRHEPSCALWVDGRL
mmetsp:Transcript_50400/g.133906  ORF Transcript_50400/g.133906 Transcript_50400/m.133906 type:complete len:115 (+) Transcript_50400:2305-2649(+)